MSQFRRLNSSDALASTRDKALTEPIAITRNGRERLALISAEEYRRLYRRAREVLPVEVPSDADLAAFARAEMASRRQHIGDELT